MMFSRSSALLNALFSTVFITVIAGILLWIVMYFAVSEAERAFAFFGLLARSWERGHRFQIDLITAVLWTPIIVLLAVYVFRRFLATEKEIRNGNDV